MTPVEGDGGTDADATMMIVECPRCKTRYRVRADDVPAEGRQLRCIRCSLSWFFVPTAAPQPHAEQSGLLPGLSTAREGNKTRGADYWPEFWWGYAVATVGILMAATYVFHEDISGFLPVLHAPLEAYVGFLEDLFLR